MSFKKIRVEKEEGVATITLNRPEVLNALDLEAVNEFSTVMEDVDKDERVRAVLITGTGRGFCAGADLRTMGSGDWLSIFHSAIGRITTMEKPVIALINGITAGAGFDMALACDIRIAADNARFSEIFVRRGLLPDCGGTYFLPKLVGIGKAKELIFTGDMIDAKEAERIGLVNKVVPSDELNSTGEEMARRLARGPTKAIGLAKKAINQAMESDLTSALKYAAEAMGVILQTEDAKEGIMAFLEKRDPKFKGK